MAWWGGAGKMAVISLGEVYLRSRGRGQGCPAWLKGAGWDMSACPAWQPLTPRPVSLRIVGVRLNPGPARPGRLGPPIILSFSRVRSVIYPTGCKRGQQSATECDYSDLLKHQRGRRAVIVANLHEALELVKDRRPHKRVLYHCTSSTDCTVAESVNIIQREGTWFIWALSNIHQLNRWVNCPSLRLKDGWL